MYFVAIIDPHIVVKLKQVSHRLVSKFELVKGDKKYAVMYGDFIKGSA